MPEFEVLAQNTKKKRKEKNKTQLVFGTNCGISKDEISNIENGATDPKLSTIQSTTKNCIITKIPEVISSLRGFDLLFVIKKLKLVFFSGDNII